jgi:hypothetical protein
MAVRNGLFEFLTETVGHGSKFSLCHERVPSGFETFRQFTFLVLEFWHDETMPAPRLRGARHRWRHDSRSACLAARVGQIRQNPGAEVIAGDRTRGRCLDP